MDYNKWAKFWLALKDSAFFLFVFSSIMVVLCFTAEILSHW